MKNEIPPQSIINWVDKYFDYKTRRGKNGDELVLANPFYHNDNKKLNISLEKAVVHDWRGDEWAGPINPNTGKRNCSFIRFVKLYKNCSYAEALEEVLGRNGATRFLKPNFRIKEHSEDKLVSIELPKGSRLLSNANCKQSSSIKKWLIDRGYTEESIRNNEIHFIGMEAIWLYYEFDNFVYWQSRSKINKKFNFPPSEILDKNHKVIGKSDGSKGDFLYGFDNVESATYIIITEAIFDQNTLGSQAMSSGGAVLTSNQIKKIKILGPKDGIILSPDNDSAGIKSIITNHAMLKKLGYNIYFSLPPFDFEGKQIKDWNQLFTDHGLTISEIREIHDNNIQTTSSNNMVRLRKLINTY